MKQVELYAPESIRVIETPRPSPGPDELLVAVARVGICGSDLHAYHGPDTPTPGRGWGSWRSLQWQETPAGTLPATRTIGLGSPQS
jgi:hypothetical protein